MIKKILVALAAAIVIPISTFAITLSELQNNPDQYKLIGENSAIAAYADTYSVANIRYSPPYYTLSGDMFMILYNENYICQYSYVVNYNYYYSHESVAKRIHDGLPADDYSSGVQMTYTHYTAWDYDGNCLEDQSCDYNDGTMPSNSLGYAFAEYLFHRYYGQWF